MEEILLFNYISQNLFGATEEIKAHKTEILYCHDVRIKFHEKSSNLS
jgi:hypothetical protein